MRITTLVILLATTFPISLTGQDGSATPPSNRELVNKVTELVASRLQDPGGVGYSLAIARGGEIILAEGYGRAEVEFSVPADADTVFRIGSVTKQFTAAAIMRLVEQDRLSLDDDVNEYLPGFSTQGQTVTIRHLLTHTSGIKSYTAIDEFWRTGAAVDLRTEEVLAYVEGLDFDFVPGEDFKYSNTGYFMLGAIIEQASGVPYCQFVQDELCVPLGLDRIRCDSSRDVIPNRAQGYDLVQGTLVNDALLDMDNVGGAGMLMSSARDLVAWEMALLGGDVVSAASVEQMITPTDLPDGRSTGYGFGLNPGEYKGHRAVMHSGGVFGFTAMLVCFPDDDLYIAGLANVFGGDVPAQSLVRDIATIAFGLDENVVDLDMSADEIARFGGTYVLSDTGAVAWIFEQEGQLYIQPSGDPATRLLYQGMGEFRLLRDTSMTLVFDPEKGPDLVLHVRGERIRGTREVLVDLAPSVEEAARFSGTYLLDRVGVELEILEQDGYLFLKPPGQPASRLLHQGHGAFRAQQNPTVKVIFDTEHGRDLEFHQGGGQVMGVRQSGD